MLGEPSTLASTGIAVSMALAEHGLDADAIFAEVGLDASIFKEHEARVPLSQVSRLWGKLVEVSGDPAVGLVIARHVRPTLYHALGQSLLASASIADAVQRICRYGKTVTSGTELEVVKSNSWVDLQLSFPHASIQPVGQARDFILGLLVNAFRMIAGSEFRPMRVSFSHSDQGAAETYREFFDCEVLFEAAHDGIRVDNHAFSAANDYANPAMAQEIDKISELYLRKLDTPGTSYRVQHLIQQGLPSGELSQDEIARRLNRSISSLRRDLQNEGTSYKALLEETREELAKAYITEGRYGLAEVAYLLGFSDQANFTRAFKRWTGTTPSEFGG
ncbi:MAG: AraC family transcriptional regulator [Gammaproteobacteria bacterium]|nr:AraC family transcriptional regulator [Gammaproteobacteria bacterium]